MPYKDKRKYAVAMRRYRRRQKAKLVRLRTQFPDVWKAVFGITYKPRRKKKKRRNK